MQHCCLDATLLAPMSGCQAASKPVLHFLCVGRGGREGGSGQEEAVSGQAGLIVLA